MADELSRVFAALADPTRRDLVARLTDGDATVGDLAAPYDVSLQAVSKHLKVLEEAGLVTRSRDAQRRPVHLEAEVFDLMTAWIERYRRRAEERYQRLDDVLAAPGRRRARRPTRPPGRNRIMSTAPADTRYDQTAIEADPTVPVIHIRRDFVGTPEQLFRAHTDPRAVRPVDRPGRHERDDPRVGRHQQRQVALRRRRPRRQPAVLPRQLPHGLAPRGSCRPSPGRACPTASPSRP